MIAAFAVVIVAIVVLSNMLVVRDVPIPRKICGIEEGASLGAAEMVDSLLSKAPDRLVSEFVESGWTIEVTRRDLSGEFFSGTREGVVGVTDPNNKSILIESSETSVREVTLHEFGHWMDVHYGKPSETREFEKSIRESDRLLLALVVEPFALSREELFAEAFEAYVDREVLMRVFAPRVLEYMEACVQASGS